MKVERAIVAAMFGLLFAACTTDSPLGHDLGPLTIEVDPALPNVVHLAWEGVEGTSHVAYGLDGALDQATPDSTDAAATAMSLKSGRTYTFRATTVAGDGTEWTSEPAELTIAAPFVGMPAFEIADGDASAWQGDGFVLLTIFQATGSFLAVVDREGDYVWTMSSREGTAIPSAHFSDDGRRIVYIDNDFTGTGWGGVGVVALDGTTNVYRELPFAHHDAIELPDGSMAWLEFEKREITTEEGDIDTFTTDAIYTASTLDGEPRRVFSVFDDYGHTPWHVCSHSANEAAIVGGEDFTHGNTLMFDAASDNFLYQSKFLDAIVAVDRGSGTVEWQAGGRFGTFTDDDGDTIDPERAYDVDGPHQTWWSHAHMSHAWPEGFVVYDNGTHHSPLVSRIAAYSWDTAAHTLRRTFAFTNEAGTYDPILGDVRRLDGGNYLVSWTMSGLLTEVTPDGRVVWRASAELGSGIGRTGYLETFYP